MITYPHEEAIAYVYPEGARQAAFHSLCEEAIPHPCEETIAYVNPGGEGTDNHGKERIDSQHPTVPLSKWIVDHRSSILWGGGGGVRTMQPHYFRAKHGFATNVNNEAMISKYVSSRYPWYICSFLHFLMSWVVFGKIPLDLQTIAAISLSF